MLINAWTSYLLKLSHSCLTFKSVVKYKDKIEERQGSNNASRAMGRLDSVNVREMINALTRTAPGFQISSL